MAQINYITVQGDTWDFISFKVYDNEHYIDILISANPSYMNITIFPANIELVIPEIELERVDTLPPWKKVITK
ncbi:tail protein X [Cellulosilyticum sp. ST5]|uniref:tail protein X n=1 Tax=Cellulosilyticum sp. ST5 TaxID=3055805 RepID=UPI003977594E